jgi:hypothetical protein
MSEPEGKNDRRTSPRYKLQLPIEIRVPEKSFPTQGSTTDLSVNGCYVSSAFPFPVGQTMEVKVWAGDQSVKCNGVVRTMDPGVGNGIQFVNLDAASREVLSKYLETHEPGSPSDPDDLLSQIIR